MKERHREPRAAPSWRKIGRPDEDYMRTVNADGYDRPGECEAWVIAFALSWCVIRIELPMQPWSACESPSGSRFNAWRRRPATAQSSPRAAARTKATSERRTAANGWRG